MLKSQIPFTRGRGKQVSRPTFDAESKSAKIPNSLHWGQGGGEILDQLLMRNPNLLKFQIPLTVGGGDSGPTFVAGLSWSGQVVYSTMPAALTVMHLSPEPPPMLVDMSASTWIKKAQLPCRLLYSQQVSHQKWI